MDWTTTIATAVASYGPLGVLTMVFLRRLARSRPAQALAEIAATDIRFRYMRLRGIPEDERQEWLKDQIDSMAREHPPDEESKEGNQQAT